MNPGPHIALSPTALAGGSGSQAVMRALSLLSLVGRGGSEGLGLAWLADQAGVTRPTARRLLLALAAARLVDQDPLSRRYHLGPETYLLGSFAAERHGILHHARPSMLRLAEETGDTVLLTVPQDDHTLCLERIEGSFPVRTYALMRGDRKPAGVGAGALAILAALPPIEAEALRRRVDHLVGDLAPALAADEVQARAQGFAFNQGRIVPGSWGLGVAFRWPDGRPAGALSIAAIENRMQADRRPHLIASLRTEVQQIETRLAALGRKPESDPKRSSA
ncbi:IclR family transcriptional regulator [Paracoccus sp. CPCC 101403]|uniref:IclR family transcriptional regulator n=2 Tax=Paracoccus broussonetiae TaxID=3075834 RepID=A0ABU3E9W9_9RHOB|nr:IclR family transcriptional regulator [Paracoccus sp. CPCC 101403]